MNEFLTELKELLQKHNAKIVLYVGNDGSHIVVAVNEQSMQFDYGIDIDEINIILNTKQPKLKVGDKVFALEMFMRNLTVKTSNLDETGETIVTFYEINNEWKYSQLQTLGLVE